MAEFKPSSTNEIPGPWLLDEKSLMKLNDTTNEIKKKISESIGSSILINSKVIIKSKSGEKIEDTDIPGVLKSKHSKEIKPVELDIIINYDNDFIKINFLRNGKYTSHIKVDNPNLQEDIYFLLGIWLAENKPNKIYQFWSSIPSILFIVFALIPIISGVLNIRESKEDLYKNNLIQESKNLIENGINDKNFYKAEELILKIQTDYVPANYSMIASTFNYNSLKLILTTSLILIFLLFKPVTIIGIFGYKRRLKFYQYYFKKLNSLVGLLITIILTYLIHKYIQSKLI